MASLYFPTPLSQLQSASKKRKMYLSAETFCCLTSCFKNVRTHTQTKAKKAKNLKSIKSAQAHKRKHTITHSPMQSDWPRPTCVVWCTASYVRVPDRDTIPVKQKYGKSQRHCDTHFKQTSVLLKQKQQNNVNILHNTKMFCQI